VNRCLVITGASKGIGLASAEILSARGWSVIGIARHKPHSFPGIFITADLADPEATRRLGDDIAARKDVLGIVPRRPSCFEPTILPAVAGRRATWRRFRSAGLASRTRSRPRSHFWRRTRQHSSLAKPWEWMAVPALAACSGQRLLFVRDHWRRSPRQTSSDGWSVSYVPRARMPPLPGSHRRARQYSRL
jgi:NAD(P)-dependent dehydrogenase (short-subunit alcohol dehydrogenase family)